MAVAPTGNIFKALSFDNVSSRTYGVYITGSAVYNAPEREVEMISIPGRNGQFALDKGRFENIEVTYPAGIFADSETDFADAISEFRNFLCSRNGYVRLQDEYNPNEYRMAIYKSGLEVEPAQLKAGEFEITFDCKPQRFLTSGETAVTVANNGTLTNPTLFEASPLLEVTGYGDVTFEGQTVTLNDVPYGDLKVGNAETTELSVLATNIDTSRLNSGDVITLRNAKGTISFKKKSGYSYVYGYLLSETNGRGYVSTDGKTTRFILNDIEFIYGTANTVTGSISIETDYRYNGENYEDTDTFTIRAEYDGGRNIRILATGYTPEPFTMNLREIGWDDIYAFSTKSALTTSYIDLDLGEAWDIVNGTTASLNNVVQIPAKLPTLKPGANTFTKSDTITSLKVTPRWWKV